MQGSASFNILTNSNGMENKTEGVLNKEKVSAKIKTYEELKAFLGQNVFLLKNKYDLYN